MPLYDFHGNEIPTGATASVDDGFFNTFLFTKGIFIGDSLTYGTGCTKVAEQAYPVRFGQIAKWTVTNGGKGGATPTSWLAEKYSSYTYADYEVAFVELGTNRGLTDTLDSDVNPYENYADYADTHTGNYCKLIEKLKEDNNKLFIVLVISPNLVKGAYSSTPNVIIKIAEKYNLPVIDLRNIEEDLMNSKYSYRNDGTHLNAVGYMAKARAVYKRFCKICVDRAEEIKTMFFAI
jgi:lysophospholipase L1-like esterase